MSLLLISGISSDLLVTFISVWHVGYPAPDGHYSSRFRCSFVLNNVECSVARFGPRHIRAESAMLRHYCGTGAAPWESMMVADIGDVNVNLYDLKDACKRIREAYRKVVATGCIPLTLGEISSDQTKIIRERQNCTVSYSITV